MENTTFWVKFFATKFLLALLIILFALYPLLHMYVVENLGEDKKSNWELRNRFGHFLGFSVGAIIVVAFLELQPIAIQEFQKNSTENWLTGLTAGSGAVGATLAIFAEKLLPKLSNLYGKLAFYFIGLIGAATIWLLCITLVVRGVNWDSDASLVDKWWATPPSQLALYGGIALVLFAYTRLTVDVNFTGIHKFYRDRLSKAYIVGLKVPEEPAFSDSCLSTHKIEHTDTLKLSELNTRHTPYHLINALLNLKQTDERFKTGRHGDFFLFSKHFIGGELTGYCNTKDMEGVSRHVDLATAMAISGAAASANMGKMTIRPLIFVLAMLNVRLNYWLPNPARLGRKAKFLNRLPAGFMSRVSPVYLLMEMFGINTAKSRYINLSDGGHIENLGIYELIRRQCRLIIAGDGEGDASLEFGGLADLIRMVQIDLGIKIEVDGLDEIRRGEQHHAVGTIHYPNGRIGKLIYLKTSLMGDNNLIATLDNENYGTSPYRDDNLMFDDDVYVANYKALNSAFPHQSTGDQFFDEVQFECYRALGYSVAMRTLRANS